MMLPSRSLRPLTFALLCFLSYALEAGIASGPMLGPVEMREAKIWVQTEGPAQVRVAYAKSSIEAETHWSRTRQTDSANGHTATLVLSEVEPGQNYEYRVEINGQLLAESHQFTSPAFYHGRRPPPDFKVAVGGAHYVTEEGFDPPYQTLGSGYEIFEQIHQVKPSLMIWLGNTAHLRESDWFSKSGYLKRYQTARSREEMHTFLATVPQYATWGSADYGSPYADGNYSFRSFAESSFRAFWPRPTDVEVLDGIATRFRYADAEFFLLDTQSYRNDQPTSRDPLQILGPAQIEWLRRELVRSTATFKIISAGAPILNPADSRTNLSYASSEHTKLLQMFRDEGIGGLVFLSGGKYYGELTRLVHANSYSLFDLTLGPLTAAPTNKSEELNFFRMPGTSVFERHFATLDFSGPEESRSLTIRVIGSNGETFWSREISAIDLQAPEQQGRLPSRDLR